MFNSRHIKIIFNFILIFVLAFSSFTGVYAKKTDDFIPVFDFVNGMDEEIQPIKYSNKDLSIRGKALEGTDITISTYLYVPDSDKTILYKDKTISENAASGEWIQEDSQTCTVGISGIFGVSITVKPGRNKIIIESDSGSSYELEVEYVDNEEIVEKINTIFFKDLDLELEY